MKKVLVLQLRKDDAAADNEFEAIIKYGGLNSEEVERIRMEKGIPDIDLEDYSAVIIGGGPWNVSDAEDKKSPEQKVAEKKLMVLLKEIVASDFPFLGACYGFGMLARQQGIEVSKEKYAEPSAGALTIYLSKEAGKDPLLVGLPQAFRAFAGHKEACQSWPEKAVPLASSNECPFHMFRIGENVYGTQFHPEVDADGLCLRIDIYKNAGYFPPEQAEELKAAGRDEEVTVPMQILKRFIDKYHSNKHI